MKKDKPKKKKINKPIIHKKHKEKNKETPECKHNWIPLIGRVGNKDVPTALFTCMECGEMKVGTNTIRISRYRLDMGGHPLYAGDVVLGENAGLTLDTALSADGKYCGIVEDGTAGATLAFGDLCYFIPASSKWGLAKADSTTTSGDMKIGICVLAGTDTQTTKILLYGKIRADAKFPTFTISAPVHISDDTAGAIMVGVPVAADSVTRRIGVGNTADELFFSPSPSYYTHADLGLWYGGRGMFLGGYDGGGFNIIQYITIATTGNSTDFGDLTHGVTDSGTCSNGTRGVIFCGYFNSIGVVNNIEYITIATTGNSVDFGDTTVTRCDAGACSDGVKGIWGGGYISPYNTIDYITIASVGNAIDFGDLTVSRFGNGGCSNGVRGIFGAGTPDESSSYNTIDYITIASLGNAIDFGDLTVARFYLSSCFSLTRGIFGGGNGPSNVIDYVIITSLSNATDFGDLTVARWQITSCSNGTRGVFGEGRASGATALNVIDYITIATIGNATDFGDLVTAGFGGSACSGN